MTYSNSLPHSANSSSRTINSSFRSNSKNTEGPSHTGSVNHFADIEQETKQTSVASKRQSEVHDDPENHSRRKQSKIGESDFNDKISFDNPPPRSPLSPIHLYEPDWDDHLCWAFLQSLNPYYEDLYLKRKTSLDTQSNYVIGRDSSSDIVIDEEHISRSHFSIYKETGSNGCSEGVTEDIRIFLKDNSYLGTFVNGKKVGQGNRILLKDGDEISMYYSPENEIEMRHRPKDEKDIALYKFFRILLSPDYAVNFCKSTYTFVSELGKGAFGTIYHATHNETNEEVAIKEIRKTGIEAETTFVQGMKAVIREMRAEKTFFQKMKADIREGRAEKTFVQDMKAEIREMSIMTSLIESLFVVQIKEIFDEENSYYLVLEYVKDGELFNYIRYKKKLTEDETRFIFWQLFHAIHYLHRFNIAHRDLKPENVTMADKKKLHIKVSDFGLARIEERSRSFGGQCGTPNYMAPEVLNAMASYGKRRDMWSLGVMLHICLCGYPPFSDNNGHPSMKAQITMGKFEFLSPYWDGVSNEAKDLIQKLLTVDPDERATINEAMEHPWMNMNSGDLNERKNALWIEALYAID